MSVELRSIANELTLGSMLIICSCIVEYSHVIKRYIYIYDTAQSFFFFHEMHARSYSCMNTEISILHDPTLFYRPEVFQRSDDVIPLMMNNRVLLVTTVHLFLLEIVIMLIV